MSLYREYEEESESFSDYSMEDDIGDISHKRLVKKRLEERLERKRLKDELDELDGEFDWDDFEK